MQKEKENTFNTNTEYVCSFRNNDSDISSVGLLPVCSSVIRICTDRNILPVERKMGYKRSYIGRSSHGRKRNAPVSGSYVAGCQLHVSHHRLGYTNRNVCVWDPVLAGSLVGFHDIPCHVPRVPAVLPQSTVNKRLSGTFVIVITFCNSV